MLGRYKMIGRGGGGGGGGLICDPSRIRVWLDIEGNAWVHVIDTPL